MPETPASVAIIPIGFHCRCVDLAPAKCVNVARVIARYLDRHGAPLRQRELCNAHVRSVLVHARSAGLLVDDQRRKA